MSAGPGAGGALWLSGCSFLPCKTPAPSPWEFPATPLTLSVLKKTMFSFCPSAEDFVQNLGQRNEFQKGSIIVAVYVSFFLTTLQLNVKQLNNR